MKSIIALLMLLATSGAALAGDDWNIDWYSLDAGGSMDSTGGPWELKGTIGQPDATAADELDGDGWTLTGGFWASTAEFLDQIFSDRFED